MPHVSADTWRMDRTLTLPALLTLCSTLAGATMLVATLQARLEALEARAAVLDGEQRDNRAMALRVVRIDERLEAVQRSLEDMRSEIRLARGTSQQPAGRPSGQRIMDDHQ